MNNSGGRRSSAPPGPPPVVEIQEYAKKQFVLLDRVRGRFQSVDSPPGHDFQDGIQFAGLQGGNVDAAGPSGPSLAGGFSVPPYPQSPRIVLTLPRNPEPQHRVVHLRFDIHPASSGQVQCVMRDMRPGRALIPLIDFVGAAMG